MAQAHLAHRLRDPQRLERVVPGRLAGLHVAEPTAAGAGVAEDHEGGRAALPAVADVGAGGFAADRVQVLLADQLVELAVAVAARELDLEPGRLALAEGPHVAQLEHARAARIRARARDVLAVVAHAIEATGAGCGASTASRRSRLVIRWR